MWFSVLYPYVEMQWKSKTIIIFNLLFSPTHKLHSLWSTTGCSVQFEYPSSTPKPQIVQLWDHSLMWSIIVPGLPTSILLYLLIIILELLMKREYGLIWLWIFSLPTSCLELWQDQATGQYCNVTNGSLKDSSNTLHRMTKVSLQFYGN